MPSSKQQRCEQHEPQLGAQQLCSQAQLCSQPQLASQPQLGWLQPQPPNKPKALTLPAVLSTRATATVAKAIQRFMGGTPNNGGEGSVGASFRAPEGERSEMEGRDAPSSDLGPLTISAEATTLIRRWLLSSEPAC